MKRRLLTASYLLAFLISPFVHADSLPSWNDTAPKKAIIEFVERVTKEDSPDFVPLAERIATFDNDGTLWSEQPLYFQLLYIFDVIKAKADERPEWRETEPFASVLRDDAKAVLASGEEGIVKLLSVTHSGMTTDEFAESVSRWIATAKHPTTGRLYTEMVYQPMLELLSYLRANGFKTYIVSGGGAEFVRQWAEQVYGIPPEQVVGTYGRMEYEIREGHPVIVKLPELALNNDKAGKPIGIQTFIGRRPTVAFGNSDGDFEMLEWTTSGKGARLALVLHHTDSEREWAYDRESHIGKLDRSLDAAPSKGWIVVSIKDDWNTVHPGAKP